MISLEVWRARWCHRAVLIARQQRVKIRQECVHLIGAACRLDRCNLLLVAAVILGTRCELLLQIFLEVIVAVSLHFSTARMEPNVGEEGGWWVEEVNGPTSNVALYVG